MPHLTFEEQLTGITGLPEYYPETVKPSRLLLIKLTRGRLGHLQHQTE